MNLINFVQKLTEFLQNNQELARNDVVILDEDGNNLDPIEIEYDEQEKTIYIRAEFL